MTTEGTTSTAPAATPATVTAVWDPIGQPNFADTTESAQLSQDEQRFRAFAADPSKLRRQYHQRQWLGVLLLLAEIVALSLWSKFGADATMLSNVGGAAPVLTVLIVALDFAPLLVLNGQLNTIASQLSLWQVAQRRGWHYAPRNEFGRTGALQTAFPSILTAPRGSLFGLSISNQAYGYQIMDQFWGTLGSEQQSSPFWSAWFEYHTGHGKGARTYTEYVVAIPTNERYEHPLYLQPNALGELETNPLSGGVQLESSEFNRLFKIKATSGDHDERLEAYEILNPRLMQTLIDLGRQHGPFRALFSGSTLVVAFRDLRVSPPALNLVKRTEIDDQDLAVTDRQFQTLLTVVAAVRSALSDSLAA